jgi:O-acetyl-ADP-ribose deacetylase
MMGDLIKHFVGDVRSLLLVVVVILVVIAIIGGIPTGSAPTSMIHLTAVQRGLIVVLAAVILALPGLLFYLEAKQSTKPPTDSEYVERLNRAEERMRELAPEHVILGERDFGNARFALMNSDILEAGTHVLVSSDDNYLQAKGGVAKAILRKAGPAVEAELARYRRLPPMRQGYLAITTGGSTGARAIFHPAIIDLDQNRYPDQTLIRKVVRRSLTCADALGAETIAFPVLGGGTAGKHLTPWESIQAIVAEVLDYLKQPSSRNDASVKYVTLYVFNRNDLEGDINALLKV